MATQREVDIFISLLKYFDIFEPEEKYKIVCPFHDDNNASLQINVTDAFFFCYAGCGAQGSSLELYKNFYKIRNPNNPEISDLKAQIAINKITGIKSDRKIKVNQEFQIQLKTQNQKQDIQQSREYYYNLPDANWYRPSASAEVEEEIRTCREYMQHRGFSNTALTKFQAKPSLNRYYPIIFPLLENNIFRGYVMRTFDPEIEEKRKYLYNKGFRRQKALPGYFKNCKTVVCVEGYLDLIKANQIGVKDVVSFLGWKASEIHLQKLKRAGVKTIICALDNDDAGRKGYRFLQRVSKQYGFKIKRLRYPKGIKDFGDVKQNSKESIVILQQIKRLLDT